MAHPKRHKAQPHSPATQPSHNTHTAYPCVSSPPLYGQNPPTDAQSTPFLSTQHPINLAGYPKQHTNKNPHPTPHFSLLLSLSSSRRPSPPPRTSSSSFLRLESIQKRAEPGGTSRLGIGDRRSSTSAIMSDRSNPLPSKLTTQLSTRHAISTRRPHTQGMPRSDSSGPVHTNSFISPIPLAVLFPPGFSSNIHSTYCIVEISGPLVPDGTGQLPLDPTHPASNCIPARRHRQCDQLVNTSNVSQTRTRAPQTTSDHRSQTNRSRTVIQRTTS